MRTMQISSCPCLFLTVGAPRPFLPDGCDRSHSDLPGTKMDAEKLINPRSFWFLGFFRIHAKFYTRHEILFFCGFFCEEYFCVWCQIFVINQVFFSSANFLKKIFVMQSLRSLWLTWPIGGNSCEQCGLKLNEARQYRVARMRKMRPFWAPLVQQASKINNLTHPALHLFIVLILTRCWKNFFVTENIFPWFIFIFVQEESREQDPSFGGKSANVTLLSNF